MFVGMLKREDKISLGKFDLYFNLPSTSIVHARMLRYFAISSHIQQNYFVWIRVENERKSHERDEVDDIKMFQLNSIAILSISFKGNIIFLLASSMRKLIIFSGFFYFIFSRLQWFLNLYKNLKSLQIKF